MPVRRVFYFSILEEKENFLNAVKCNVGKLKNEIYFEKEQIKETLIKIVSDDKFLDDFISLLKQRRSNDA
jgi:hypothetical protein